MASAQAKVCNPNLPEEATMLGLLCTMLDLICTICIVATDQDKFGGIYKLYNATGMSLA